MRTLALAALLALCACDDHGTGACIYQGTAHAADEVFPAGDGCNSCSCSGSTVTCGHAGCTDGGVDASALSCAAFGGCPEAPACGAVCCKRGEHCVNGTCQCGTRAACGSGDLCEAPGPVTSDRCGSLCCGASGPCPL
jgi:hypothetical protein